MAALLSSMPPSVSSGGRELTQVRWMDVRGASVRQRVPVGLRFGAGSKASSPSGVSGKRPCGSRGRAPPGGGAPRVPDRAVPGRRRCGGTVVAGPGGRPVACAEGAGPVGQGRCQWRGLRCEALGRTEIMRDSRPWGVGMEGPRQPARDWNRKPGPHPPSSARAPTPRGRRTRREAGSGPRVEPCPSRRLPGAGREYAGRRAPGPRQPLHSPLVVRKFPPVSAD